MIDNGLKIRIKGIPFKKDEFTEFPLLKKNPNKKKQSTIIYGKNGAGKTSISNAIAELKTEYSNRYFISEFIDENYNILSFDFSKQVYVFNEKFIDSKIRFTTTDGLDTIVLLGDELIDVDEINDIEERINAEQEKLNKIDLSIYNDEHNRENPVFLMNKIINVLKRDGNWASRQQKINRLSRKASVNEKTVKKIVKDHSKKIKVDEYEQLLKKFLKINKTDEKYKEFFQIPINNFDASRFDNLIEKKLEAVSHDEMAKRILTTIENYSENRINEVIDVFNSDVEYCPYCFRPIDNLDKQSIIDKIKSVLSNESDDFIAELEKLKLLPYTIKLLPDFIDDFKKNQYNFACKNYNDVVIKINDFIEKKKVNLYSSLSSTLSEEYLSSYECLVSIIGEINSLISSHNVSIDEYDNMKKDLEKYCNYLSWETIKDLYKEYIEKNKNKKENEHKFNVINKNIIILKEKLNDLNSKKKNVKDAGTEINRSLSYIFLDNNRLSLSLDDNRYIVLSNGKPVPLKKLSTGERNIISLCYFFCSIGEGKKTKQRYDDEYLIFIDDPISSFDHDNKIGIYSLLRDKIKNFKNSNFIFLTHNYEVGYNLAKIFNDVYGNGNSKGRKSNHITNYLEIKERQVVDTSFDLSKGKNQYKLLLQEIFNYACDKESKLNDLTIGNSIRRILEMFATFEYNVGFERVIDKIKDDGNLNKILKNYMYRILLNNESHSMLSAYAFDEVNRFEMFSSDEKHLTAKLALIMLNILNSNHISSYLSEEDCKTLKKWSLKIENNKNSEMLVKSS